MKVCITHVKTYKKAASFKVKNAFVEKLINCGMPEEMAAELMENNKVIWQREDVDCNNIYAAEVMDEDEE